MLVELIVENYAVVERVRVRFGAGLNLLTGETGSGKSIVVDSLGLLFGGRASADMIRTGAPRARVSGIFEVPLTRLLRALLEEHSLELEEGELLIEREILPNGKSRAFAAGRPVTAALLRELAPHLGDIHGQHDQQKLFEPAAQLDTLDAFTFTGASTGAATGATFDRVSALYHQWRDVARELEELERSNAETLRLKDLWTFQNREIESTAPLAGEDARLETERRVLMNVSRLHEHAQAAYDELYEGEPSALSLLGKARRHIDDLIRVDTTLGHLAETLAPAEAALDDAAHTLRAYLSKLEADPARLDEIESRLAALERLKRKYGPTLDDVIRFGEDVMTKLSNLENSDELRAALHKKREALGVDYAAAAAQLSKERRAAARKLEQKVQAELAELAMERTRFSVAFAEQEWSESGTDRITFLIAPNAGEEPKPLDRIASGGELSRLALALKTCATSGTSAQSTSRTLVFDEVDAGIGGATAESVGRRLKRLSSTDQLLCVTHLAQIASFADQHYVVEKREVKGRTMAELEQVTGEARTREIARMLSGQRMTPEALKHAEQLVKHSAGKRALSNTP
ncbi:MAG: DNA repair protein RecN [Bryobacterales bacterium]|nr:DNA repair protein RecN [Bryobacterales bacterium]